MRKSIYSTISLLALYLFFFTLACKNKQSTYSYTDKLNIREKPLITANVIGQINKDDMIYYLNEKGVEFKTKINSMEINGSWLKVETASNKIGWIFSGALECSKSTNIDEIESFCKSFNDLPWGESKSYYLPTGRYINTYLKPHLGTTVYKKFVGPFRFEVLSENNKYYNCIDTYRNWIKIEYTDEVTHKVLNLYLITENLIDENKHFQLLSEKILILNKYFDKLENTKYPYKSIKKYKEGDADETWLEECHFDISLCCNIYFGSRDLGCSYIILDIYKDQDYYYFVTKATLYSKKIRTFKVKFYPDKSLELFDAGVFSGKFIPGEAKVYPQ